MSENARHLNLREQQLLELEMLKAFREICKDCDLYYTLAGGTLLGAIRHNGFIPWDDDIDVLMPRPDFERLGQMIREETVKLPPHLRFCSWYTDPGMSIPFIKIVDLRTAVGETYMVGDKHLWIDIFAMDGSTENDRELKKQFRQSKYLRSLLFKKNTRPGTGKTRFRSFAKDIIRTALKPVSAKHLCMQIESVAKRYRFDHSPYIAGAQWGYGPQERINREAWMTPENVLFEGEFFAAPSNYDEYLTNLYGDYMKLPPADKQIIHEMNVLMENG